MATIDQRLGPDGTKVFRIRVRRKGYATQTATFAKLSEAKQWLQSTETAIREGRYFQKSAAKTHTLTDVINRYLREILPHKRPSTIPTQAQHLHWWQTQLGHYVLADITPALVGEHRSILLQGRANATVVRYLAVLSHAFTIAVREWQWCEDNPVRKVSKPKEPRGRVRFLSDEERQQLLAACKVSRNRLLYPVVVLALSTGARTAIPALS